MLFFCNLSNRIAVADKKDSVLFVYQLNRVVGKLKLQNHRSTNRNITTLRISFTCKNIIPPSGSHSALSLTGNIRTDNIAALYQILKLRLELRNGVSHVTSNEPSQRVVSSEAGSSSVTSILSPP